MVIKKQSGQIQGGSEASSQNQDSILLVGVGQFGAGLAFNQFSKFSVIEKPINIKSISSLGTEKDLDAMIPPVVVVLGLVDHADDAVRSIKQAWPQTSIIIAGDEERLDEVYPLMALGATDYISLKASNDELQANCLLRIGAHSHRIKESSRSFGRLTINLMQRTVTNGRETAYLTPIEVKIVRTLADNLGKVVERNAMKQLCWGDAEITDNALNRKIYEVRRTLRRLSESVNIRTIYGLGFELRVRG